MKKTLVSTAVVAALAFCGVSAHASCMDPSNAGRPMGPMNFNHGSLPFHGGHNAGDNIVGTWHVIYTPDGTTTESGEAFIQWHRDRKSVV